MTMSSSPGTRADRFPLVQTTSPLRGSSACSSQTSRRMASSSPTGQLPGAWPEAAGSAGCAGYGDVAQPVHDVVAAAAEVVVQAQVVLVQDVVGVGAPLVGHVAVAPD